MIESLLPGHPRTITSARKRWVFRLLRDSKYYQNQSTKKYNQLDPRPV